MRLHLVLAAMLAALFAVGCSSEKSIAPKVLASAEPQAKPVQPNHEAVDPAPPPTAGHPPATATGSPPPSHEASADDTDESPASHEAPAEDTDKPPTRPDPWANVTPEWKPYYKQVYGMLEPVAKVAGDAARAAFQPEWSEDEKRKYAVWWLGQWQIPFSPEEETALRALVAKAERMAGAARDYFTAVKSLLAEPEKGHLLAAAYERAIDEGAVIPADARKKVVKWVESSEPDLLRDVSAYFRQQREYGPLSLETEYVRRGLLAQTVYGSSLFRLASHIHTIGESVVEKRELCRTLYDLVMALPEPHRSEVLMKLAWSPTQEAEVHREREKLMKLTFSHVNPKTVMMMPEDRFRCESLYARELRSIAADRHKRFLALEVNRRDTIEGCFHNVDERGLEALNAVDMLVVHLQNALGKRLGDLGYRFRSHLPPDAHALPKIPLPGSVKDRMPTIRISDFEIVFDAPAKPLTATVASPPQSQEPTKGKPDPYARVDATWRPSYEQFKELLEPSVTPGGTTVQPGSQPPLSDDEQKKLAVVRLGEYKVSLNREAERRLRALLADIKDTETKTQRYLAAADALVAGPAKARMLATAYEEAIHAGADIPADLRQELAELIRSNDPPQGPTGNIAHETESLQTKLPQQSVTGNDFLRLALSVYGLGQSVIERRTHCRTFQNLVMALPEPHRSDVLTELAWSPEQEAELDREREKLKEVKPSRRNPKTVRRMANGRYQYDIKRIESDYASELRFIVADRQTKFRTLERARRDTIEGCFHTMDAPGREALVALDVLGAEVQAVLDAILPDLSYRLRPLIPDRFDLRLMFWGDGSGVPTSGNNLVIAGIDNNGLLHLRIFDVDGRLVTDTDTDETKVAGTQARAISLLKQQLLFSPPDELTGAEKAQLTATVTSIVDQILPNDTPWGAASNVLPKIPLRGSVEDRVPTITVSDDVIVFDAPAGQLTYDHILRPGNVLVGTLRLREQSQPPGEVRETTYHAELHIGAVENKVVRGELVVDAQRYPFQGAIRPTGFFFEADLGTFQGSLEKGGPLTGQVLRHSAPVGSFSLALKK